MIFFRPVRILGIQVIQFLNFYLNFNWPNMHVLHVHSGKLSTCKLFTDRPEMAPIPAFPLNINKKSVTQVKSK